MLCLGVETSCDETAIALVEDGRTIRSNLILSQIDKHQKFGGWFPSWRPVAIWRSSPG